MSAIRGDIIHTIVCQGLVVAAQFLQYRLVSDAWGIETLSGYTLMYRVRGAMEWIVVIVLPLAVARLMSAEAAPQAKLNIAVAGLAGGLSLYLAVAMLLLVAPALTAQILFGRSEYAIWVLPLCALLGAYCTFMLASGVLRGMFAFREANVSNVISIAVIPTLCLLLGRGHDIRSVVIWMSTASALATFAALAVVVSRRRSSVRLHASLLAPAVVLSALKPLLSFGSPRLVTLGLSAVFAVCLPWLVSSGGGAELLANLNVMLALLGAAAMITSPVGFVLLPHFSLSLAAGEKEHAATQLRTVFSATVFVGVVASFLAIALIPLAMSLLLGQMRATYVPLVAAIAIALPFFMVFDVLRSPLDAVSRAPLNALTYLAGLLGTVVVYTLSAYAPELSIITRCAAALVAGNVCAAAVCLASAARSFGRALVSRGDVYFISAWLLALTSWILVSGAKGGTVVTHAPFAAGGLICCGLYLWRVRPRWFETMLCGVVR